MLKQSFKNIIIFFAIFLVLPINYVFAGTTIGLQNWKYGPNNQSVITSDAGTWPVANGGKPVDATFIKNTLGGFGPTAGTGIVYLSPKNGGSCTDYSPNCTKMLQFFWVDKSDTTVGQYVSVLYMKNAQPILDEQGGIQVAAADGTTTPPAPNPGLDPTKMFVSITGKVYLDSKDPANLVKNQKFVKIDDPAIDNTLQPFTTDANGQYTIDKVSRSGSNGHYTETTYKVYVDSLGYTGSTNVTIDTNGKVSDADIIVTKVAGCPTFEITPSGIIQGALCYAIGWVGNILQTTLNWTAGGVNYILAHTQELVLTDSIQNVWLAFRDITLVILVLALLIMAFMNVLSIDLETYGLNRMIPKIIIAIILASFSWFIMLFFFDFTTALQNQAVGLIQGANPATAGGLVGLSTLKISLDLTSVVSAIGAIFLILLIALGVLIALVVLFFELILRIVILALLAAVAPIAMILSIMPFTETVYKRWWSEYWKWLFMGPMTLIIIALGTVVAGAPPTSLNQVAVTHGFDVLIKLAILAGCIFIAADLPLQWGGKIMQNWNKGAKWLGRNTGATGAFNNIREHVAARAGLQQNVRAAKLSRALTGGRVGTDPRVLLRAEQDNQVQKFAKEFEASNASPAELLAATQRGGARGIAAWQALAKTDNLDFQNGIGPNMASIYETMGTQRADAMLMGTRKEHPDRFMPGGAVDAARPGGVGTQPAFNFDNIMAGMKQDDYLSLHHSAFADPNVTQRLNLNDAAAEKITNRQLNYMTADAATGANLGNVQTLLGQAAPGAGGMTWRQAIEAAVASNNPDNIRNNVGQFQAFANGQNAPGGATNVAAQFIAADSVSVGRMINKGKL